MSQSYVKYTLVPKFTVNLDLKPEKRWNDIIDTYKTKFESVMIILDDMINNFGFAGIILKWLTWFYSEKVFYIEELRAISKRSRVKLEKLIIMQLCYELFACCTSILINEGDNILHYRTMDWEIPELKDLTIEVDFTKDGKKIFSATTWAGYVGVMTGIKPDICTIALNYRRTGESILTNYNKSINGSWPVGFLIRHLFETENNCDKIKGSLINSSLISPCYLTIGGAKSGDGIILCRTRDKTDKMQIIGSNDHDFIVQTNIDHTKEFDNTCENIMYSQERIGIIKSIMEEYRTVNKTEKLVQQFNEWPIINNTTIYVTTMCCSTGQIYSYI